jgi:hypothetical protein
VRIFALMRMSETLNRRSLWFVWYFHGVRARVAENRASDVGEGWRRPKDRLPGKRGRVDRSLTLPRLRKLTEDSVQAVLFHVFWKFGVSHEGGRSSVGENGMIHA